jgi:hypothetical protein
MKTHTFRRTGNTVISHASVLSVCRKEGEIWRENVRNGEEEVTLLKKLETWQGRADIGIYREMKGER